MEQQIYDDKLQKLIEIFDGDHQYARQVLDKWLQKNRAALEARLLAEVARRLEGLSSIIPLSFKIIIDNQGVRLPGQKPAGPERAERKKPEKPRRPPKKAKESHSLFEA